MKITRNTFLYLDPQPPVDSFAQCGTCALFAPNKQICAILDQSVTKDMSCGFYLHGEPHDQEVKAIYTKDEVGLVNRQVRCENCVSFENNKCNLYVKLNSQFPNIFDLNTKVEAKGCCNAQTPKPVEDKRRSKLHLHIH